MCVLRRRRRAAQREECGAVVPHSVFLLPPAAKKNTPCSRPCAGPSRPRLAACTRRPPRAAAAARTYVFGWFEEREGETEPFLCVCQRKTVAPGAAGAGPSSSCKGWGRMEAGRSPHWAVDARGGRKGRERVGPCPFLRGRRVRRRATEDAAENALSLFFSGCSVGPITLAIAGGTITNAVPCSARCRDYSDLLPLSARARGRALTAGRGGRGFAARPRAEKRAAAGRWRETNLDLHHSSWSPFFPVPRHRNPITSTRQRCTTYRQ